MYPGTLSQVGTANFGPIEVSLNRARQSKARRRVCCVGGNGKMKRLTMDAQLATLPRPGSFQVPFKSQVWAVVPTIGCQIITSSLTLT